MAKQTTRCSASKHEIALTTALNSVIMMASAKKYHGSVWNDPDCQGGLILRDLENTTKAFWGSPYRQWEIILRDRKNTANGFLQSSHWLEANNTKKVKI